MLESSSYGVYCKIINSRWINNFVLANTYVVKFKRFAKHKKFIFDYLLNNADAAEKRPNDCVL